MFLLDTDTIIYSLKNNSNVIKKMKEYRDSPKAISIITYGELMFGAEKSQKKLENSARIRRVAEIFPVLNLSLGIMAVYGELKAGLSKQGTTVDEFDLLIAATAISNGYTVVTNNTKHFSRIPGVLIANWAE
jgi:tRNA(fMet)-specific endonuclease VapC